MVQTNIKTAYSKVSVKSQTVLPQEVRERLDIGPGDRLRYIMDQTGVRIDKSMPREEDDPFVAFSEWSSAEDDAAFASL